MKYKAIGATLVLLTLTTIVVAQAWQKPKSEKKGPQRSMCEVGALSGAMMLMFDFDAQPLITFTTASVTPDGRQLFVFGSQWAEDKLVANCLRDEAARDQFMTASIGKQLAKEHWCLSGWAIDSKQILDWPGGKQLYVEGHCR